MVTAMFIYLVSEHIFNKLNSLTFFDVKLIPGRHNALYSVIFCLEEQL